MIEMFRYHDKIEKVKNENNTLDTKIEDLSTRIIDESEVLKKKDRIEEQEEEKAQLDASIRNLNHSILGKFFIEFRFLFHIKDNELCIKF